MTPHLSNVVLDALHHFLTNPDILRKKLVIPCRAKMSPTGGGGNTFAVVSRSHASQDHLFLGTNEYHMWVTFLCAGVSPPHRDRVDVGSGDEKNLKRIQRKMLASGGAQMTVYKAFCWNCHNIMRLEKSFAKDSHCCLRQSVPSYRMHGDHPRKLTRENIQTVCTNQFVSIWGYY